MPIRLWIVWALGLASAAGCQWAGILQPWEERAWLKAALHTHTVHSDGEATPEAMLRWYGRNGYDIVALTDHNRNMPLKAFAADPGLIVLPGVEFTSKAQGKPVHVNGLFTLLDVAGVEKDSPQAALETMLKQFSRTGALAIINHPNYGLTLGLSDLAELDFTHLEIYNASSATRNDGDPATPPVEALWDALLRSGKRVYGVATDDAHSLPGGKNANVPGKAWVMLHAKREPFAIRDALEQGRFYATTGPVLATHRESRGGLFAQVKALPGLSYRWTIVDDLGVRQIAGPAVWLARPTAGYRRARLDANDGSRLYLQPIFAADGKAGRLNFEF